MSRVSFVERYILLKREFIAYCYHFISEVYQARKVPKLRELDALKYAELVAGVTCLAM